MNKYQVLEHFGLKADPFKGKLVETVDIIAVRSAIAGTVQNDDAVAVIGEVGTGKTTAVWESLKPKTDNRIPRLNIIEASIVDMETARIGMVEEAIVQDVSEEKPRKSRLARRRQVERLLGWGVRQQRKVCVVIDEAHALPLNTLRALKRLRELRYLGQSPLFSLLLIGQPLLKMKLERVKEMGLRTEIVELSGFSTGEQELYLEGIASICEPDTLALLASFNVSVLELQSIIYRILGEAYLAGEKKLSKGSLARFLGYKEEKKLAPSGELSEIVRSKLTTDEPRLTQVKKEVMRV